MSVAVGVEAVAAVVAAVTAAETDDQRRPKRNCPPLHRLDFSRKQGRVWAGASGIAAAVVVVGDRHGRGWGGQPFGWRRRLGGFGVPVVAAVGAAAGADDAGVVAAIVVVAEHSIAAAAANCTVAAVGAVAGTAVDVAAAGQGVD